MQLTVKRIGGHTPLRFELELGGAGAECERIAELKRLIAEKSGIPVWAQRLFHKGRYLRNDATLEELALPAEGPGLLLAASAHWQEPGSSSLNPSEAPPVAAGAGRETRPSPPASTPASGLAGGAAGDGAGASSGRSVPRPASGAYPVPGARTAAEWLSSAMGPDAAGRGAAGSQQPNQMASLLQQVLGSALSQPFAQPPQAPPEAGASRPGQAAPAPQMRFVSVMPLGAMVGQPVVAPTGVAVPGAGQAAGVPAGVAVPGMGGAAGMGSAVPVMVPTAAAMGAAAVPAAGAPAEAAPGPGSPAQGGASGR